MVLGMNQTYAQDKLDNWCDAGGPWEGKCNVEGNPDLTAWNYKCGYAFAHYQSGDWSWGQVFKECKVSLPTISDIVCTDFWWWNNGGVCQSPNGWGWSFRLPDGTYLGEYFEATTQADGCPPGTEAWYWTEYNTYLCID
jgi:hypothetical protein